MRAHEPAGTAVASPRLRIRRARVAVGLNLSEPRSVDRSYSVGPTMLRPVPSQGADHLVSRGKSPVKPDAR